MSGPARTDHCGKLTGARYHSRDNTPVCPPCREIARRALADIRKRRYLAGGSLIGPTTGTARRLRALARIGWSFPELGARLGVTKEAVKGWALADVDGKYLRLSTINRIAVLYDELCMTPGPSKVAAARATAKGWAGPLDWNEGEIDDPRAVPYCEIEAAHEAALTHAKWRRKAELERQRLAAVAAADPAEYERRVDARREARRQEKARYRARAAEQAA